MAPKPLDILKKGLTNFRASMKARKDNLTAKLARSKPISSSDKHWLDHEANAIDEQHVIKALESALDYEHGIAHLDDSVKGFSKGCRQHAQAVCENLEINGCNNCEDDSPIDP